MNIQRTSTIVDVRTNTTYFAELGTIDRTRFGVEDHGILTFDAAWSTGGAGQSFGGYAFDEWDEALRARRAKSGFGLRFMLAVMRAAGVATYEQLEGAQVIVLRTENYGPIVGLAHPTRDEIVIFDTDIEKDD